MFQSQSGLCTSKTLWPDKNATLYYSFQIVLHLHVVYNYVPSKVKNKSLTTVLSYSTVYTNISQFKEKNSLLPVSNPACKWPLWKYTTFYITGYKFPAYMLSFRILKQHSRKSCSAKNVALTQILVLNPNIHIDNSLMMFLVL